MKTSTQLRSRREAMNQTDNFQAAQEQDRDFHRAECDLEKLLVKVETGMAVVEDVKEIRSLIKMIGGAYG